MTPENSSKVKRALKETFEELNKMSTEEFRAALSQASEVGDEEAAKEYSGENEWWRIGYQDPDEDVLDTWTTLSNAFLAGSQHGRLSERAKHEWKNVDCMKEYRKSKLMEDKEFCHGVIEGLEESFEQERQRSARLLNLLKEIAPSWLPEEIRSKRREIISAYERDRNE